MLRNDRKPLRVRLMDATNERAEFLNGASVGRVGRAYEQDVTLLEEGAEVIRRMCGTPMVVRDGRVALAVTEGNNADGGGAAAASDGLDSEMVQEQEQEQEKEQEVEVKAEVLEGEFDRSPRLFAWKLEEIVTDNCFQPGSVFRPASEFVYERGSLPLSFPTQLVVSPNHSPVSPMAEKKPRRMKNVSTVLWLSNQSESPELETSHRFVILSLGEAELVSTVGRYA